MSEDEIVYSIKEASMLSGLTEDTIRYYEKIGLLPRAERRENGHRIYRPQDVDTLKLITCLRKTGMSLDEMKPFLHLSWDDDITAYPELYARIQSHKENIKQQMASLQQILDFIDANLKPSVGADSECSSSAEANRAPTLRSRSSTTSR